MSERNEDENRPSDNDGETGAPGPETDLRSILGGGSKPPSGTPQRERRPAAPRPERRREVAPEDEVAPPYVPPVREGDPEPRERADERAPERPARDEPPVEGHAQQGESQQNLPPVWPGDEKQPWFRRERGLPPLPESETSPDGKLDLEELPTQLADIPTRARAFGVSVLLPQLMGLLLAPFGGVVALVIVIPNLFLFSRGQDIGAAIFGLRVLRENGDVAGFFHMFVRNAASSISFIALGAGFWGAFSDPERRTWHDKWLRTYVVKDSKEYETRKRSSSDAAFSWFWVIIVFAIAVTVLYALNGPLPAETVPTPEAGVTELVE